GALTLRAYDDANRLIKLWARDSSAEPVVLCEELLYGDDLPDRVDARTRNLLGRLNRHRDEAGAIIFEEYDFKGNLLEKTRQVLDVDQLADTSFRVDWEASPQPVLNNTEYRVSANYDALNRVSSIQYPADVDGERKNLEAFYDRAGRLESLKME